MLTVQKLDPIATEQMYLISCGLQQVQVQGGDNIQKGYEMSANFKTLLGQTQGPACTACNLNFEQMSCFKRDCPFLTFALFSIG